MLSRQRGTMSWCRLAERRRRRETTSEAGMRCIISEVNEVLDRVYHDAQLVCYPFWHIEPMKFIVQKGRDHGRTSSYHWPLGQQRWALVAAYRWLCWAPLHRLCCSSRRVTSHKRARACEASISQPHRSWRYASRDLSLMRLWLQARAHGFWQSEYLSRAAMSQHGLTTKCCIWSRPTATQSWQDFICKRFAARHNVQDVQRWMPRHHSDTACATVSHTTCTLWGIKNTPKFFYHNFYSTWPILIEIDMQCLG